MPIGLVAAALAPAAINAAGGLFRSAKQKREAKKIDTTRPEYKRQAEYQQNVDMYRNQAKGNMAGYGLAKSEARDTTAETIGQINRQGGSASQRLAAIQGAGRTEAGAMSNLAMQNEQAKRYATQGLAQSRMALADEKTNEFNFNKAEPYMMNVERKRALETASGENFSNAMQGLTNAATSALPYVGKGGGTIASSAKKAPKNVVNNNYKQDLRKQDRRVRREGKKMDGSIGYVPMKENPYYGSQEITA